MSERRTPHEIESEEARRSGDPARIRRLYHSYGEDLHTAFADEEFELAQHGSPEVARWQARYLRGVSVGGPALDVGCGPLPEASLQLAEDGRRVVCADLSLGLCRIAREVARSRGHDNVSVVVADAEALPFRESVFGIVVSDDVIEHVPDPERMTAECARVCAPGGVCSIATPNGRALSVLVDRLRDLLRGRLGPPEKYFLVPSHLREFTRRQLRDLFAPFFGEVRFAAVGWEPTSAAKRAASLLTTRPPFRGLCRHWVAVLRKPRTR